MQMIPIRVFFSKTGRAKYISHLDVMRAITRALGRSGLPLWFTEGFHPHLYITFSLPLPLGYESLCESFDLRLTEPLAADEVAQRIAAVLPPGFSLGRVAPPRGKPTDIALADYSVRLYLSDGDSERFAVALDDFCAQPAHPVSKRTKKGDRTIDIKPHMQVLEQSIAGAEANLRLRCAAGLSLNINPTLFLEAFYAGAEIRPLRTQLVRQALLTAELLPFE